MTDIGQQLAGFFKAQGVTQEAIAAQLGVTQQYISGLLSGKKPFGKKQAQRFAELWGISPSWLLTGEGEMMSSTGNTQVIENNNGTAINGDGTVVHPAGDSRTIERMQNQIDELLAQNGKLLVIIDRLTQK